MQTSWIAVWQQLQWRNTHPNHLRPREGLKTLAFFALFPVIAGGFVLSLPVSARRGLGDINGLLLFAAGMGGVLLLTFQWIYRLWRQQQQLRANAVLAQQPPDDFVLYLRSFRRSGMVVVPNYLPDLAERRLLGDFWDVELALSTIVSEKLPVVAVGPQASSLGALKFVASEEGWKTVVDSLAARAKAIFIVPDDREGTLWELRTIFADDVLRSKTLVFMPPEQHGWKRRFRCLPSIASSWERTRKLLDAPIELNPYDCRGALLVMDNDVKRFVPLSLDQFQPEQVSAAIARVIFAGAPAPTVPELSPAEVYGAADPVKPQHAKHEWGEGWFSSLVDPVWPVVAVCVVLIALAFGTADKFVSALFAAFAGAGATFLERSSAFTLTRTPSPEKKLPREWFRPSTWFGLHEAPGIIRHSFNAMLVCGLLFIFRSFVAEPYKIPASSMRPTLEVGDFILVNTSIYGIRLPIVDKKIIPRTNPRRGDLVVFRYPPNPSQDFIKRVIGISGDVVQYLDKRLTVNGHPWPQQADGTFSYLEGLRFEELARFLERTDEASDSREHTIAITVNAQPVYPANVRDFPGRENCDYSERGFTCKVPVGHYFMMGDNRDNSDDSRYWGFVPEDYIRGKAFYIWFNWEDMSTGAFKHVGSIR